MVGNEPLLSGTAVFSCYEYASYAPEGIGHQQVGSTACAKQEGGLAAHFTDFPAEVE